HQRAHLPAAAPRGRAEVVHPRRRALALQLPLIPAVRPALHKASVLGIAAALLAGCSSTDGPKPVLIPNKELQISRSLAIPAEGIVLATIVYYVVDPLAPNWRIEQHDLGGHRYAFTLRKKRFAAGGDGEASQVFQRRVDALARE